MKCCFICASLCLLFLPCLATCLLLKLLMSSSVLDVKPSRSFLCCHFRQERKNENENLFRKKAKRKLFDEKFLARLLHVVVAHHIALLKGIFFIPVWVLCHVEFQSLLWRTALLAEKLTFTAEGWGTTQAILFIVTQLTHRPTQFRLKKWNWRWRKFWCIPWSISRLEMRFMKHLKDSSLHIIQRNVCIESLPHRIHKKCKSFTGNFGFIISKDSLKNAVIRKYSFVVCVYGK